MRLLLDQNLSPRLLSVIADLYPGSTHVRQVNLQAADDDTMWQFRDLGGQVPSDLRHGGLGKHRTKEAKLAEDQETQTGNGSVFSGRATQILQGELSRSTQAFHLGGEPWHEEHPGTEQHRSIEVNHCQGVSFAEPIFLAQG